MTEFRYFKRSEFACKCGKCDNLIQDSFVEKMDALRHICGFPISISSGYRCPAHNAAVSGTGDDGPHTTGCAADVPIDRKRAYILLQNAIQMGFTGIGFKQHGGVRFMHLDTLPDALGQPRPAIWSYP